MQMQNLPQEILNLIFTYTSSPTADIMRPLFDIYNFEMSCCSDEYQNVSFYEHFKEFGLIAGSDYAPFMFNKRLLKKYYQFYMCESEKFYTVSIWADGWKIESVRY